MSSSNDLQVGADRVAIQDLMARYAYAVDAKRGNCSMRSL